MTVTISIISTTKPASSIRSLTRMLKSRRATLSMPMMKMWPPSRTGIGSRLRMPRFSEIIAMRLKSWIHPHLGRAAGQLGDADRTDQLPRRGLRRQQSPQGLEDQPGPLVVPLEAHPERLEEARLDDTRLEGADRHAGQADVPRATPA